MMAMPKKSESRKTDNVPGIISWVGLGSVFVAIWAAFWLIKIAFGEAAGLIISLTLGIGLFGTAWFRGRNS
jgi:hypothetical protein